MNQQLEVKLKINSTVYTPTIWIKKEEKDDDVLLSTATPDPEYQHQVKLAEQTKSICESSIKSIGRATNEQSGQREKSDSIINRRKYYKSKKAVISEKKHPKVYKDRIEVGWRL